MKSDDTFARPNTRRDFLRRSIAVAGGVAWPMILPARVLGRDSAVPPPSERITMGAIGIGGMGRMDLSASILQDINVKTHWSVVAQHHRNSLDCVKTRARPAADAEVAHRSTTLSHVANLAMQLRRDVLRWDRHAELFVDDETANRMLARAMRAPWTL